jgi:effector-binding domain-containing protein
MKNILWLVLCFACLALLYYLVIRPFEFEVNMEAKTLPGDVISTVRIWNRSLPEAEVTHVDSFQTVKQTIVRNGKKYLYSWNFSTLDDSLTRINVRISQPGRTFLNKVLIPLTNQEIEQDAAELMHQFHAVLKTHLSITRVKVVGEHELDPIFCVCRSLETMQIEKAKGMMRDYPLLTSFVDKFKLQPDGRPIVKVRQWDHSSGRLAFDFCFPILPTDSLPESESLTYKLFEKERVLKAEYYGNYITSDRAWYELIDYASKHGHQIKGLPIEYFHNNPNMGLNESEWKAEIFLPISGDPAGTPQTHPGKERAGNQ